jgi:2-methylisocitrate lyase-like PEP mutase family enzyme
MDASIQRDKAVAFRQMHAGPRILVLPNAWDVASARIFEEAGFTAVATTSAGVAAALGYPDGEQVSREEMAAVVRRIAERVAVPVSADMEAGYGVQLADLAQTVRAVLAAGAVGMNLEDGTSDKEHPLTDIPIQIERIQAVRQEAAARGVPLVLNARTDVYLLAVGPEGERFAHGVQRANAYRKAGADCLFVPGVRDAATIAALVRALDGPLNVLAGPGTPPVPELERLGVARVSVGSGPMRAALTLTRRIAEALRGPGTYDLFNRDTLTHAEVNRLMAARPSREKSAS